MRALKVMENMLQAPYFGLQAGPDRSDLVEQQQAVIFFAGWEKACFEAAMYPPACHQLAELQRYLLMASADTADASELPRVTGKGFFSFSFVFCLARPF